MKIRKAVMVVWTLSAWLAWAAPLRAQEEPADAPPEAAESETADTAEGTPTSGEPSSATAVTESPSGPDLEGLRSELTSILDELIQARTRVAVLEKALFKTRVSVNVVRRADDQRLAHITLSLDGIPVHDSDGRSLARGEARLFEGHAAPGMHELTIEVTERAVENPEYRYVRNERFRFEIKPRTHTAIEVVLRDDSDMAEELPEGDEGEFDVSTVVRIDPEELEEG